MPVAGLQLVRRFQLRLAVGKAKAHFEFRSLDHDPAAVYGGEPCKTTHVVTARLEVCYQPLGAVDRAARAKGQTEPALLAGIKATR